jgi:putative hydrolase of the HAD superfamily
MEQNIQTVLFDWGDTLMVDFSNESGKMCDWETVEAVAGAEEVLHALAKEYTLCVATNAQDSSCRDIEKAFQRVGLDKYISHYFCFENLGVSKVSPQFFPKILEQLNSDAQNVIMVGNEYHKDIEPAVNAGIAAIHLSEKSPVENKSYIQIERLVQLKEMLLVTA